MDKGKYLKDFYSTMKDTNFDLTAFENNIDTLKIVRKEKLSNDVHTCEYHFMNNEIYYKEGYLDSGIMHELFHASSTQITDKEIKSGFLSIVNDKNGLLYRCLGLNEGYTALLDDKYFPNYTKDKKRIVGKSYYLSKYFAFLIENFVGEELMEEMYSKNQIDRLESILTYFMGSKRTNKFFFALDLISEYVDATKYPSIKIGFKCYNYCRMYLFDLYVRCCQIQYLEDFVDDELREEDFQKNMSDDEYEDRIDYIKKGISQCLFYGKFIPIHTRKDTDKELDKRIEKNMKLVQKKYTQ